MTPTEPLSLDCRETVRRVWDYLDGLLAEDERAAVEAHLATCERCPPHYAFERAFLRAVSTARREHAQPDALRERVRALLVAEGFGRS